MITCVPHASLLLILSCVRSICTCVSSTLIYFIACMFRTVNRILQVLYIYLNCAVISFISLQFR